LAFTGASGLLDEVNRRLPCELHIDPADHDGIP
jgi:hypothetical protein